MKKHPGHIKDHCPTCEAKPKPAYKEPLYIVSLATIVLLVASLYVPFLKPFYGEFLFYWEIIWWAVLLGLVIGGIIEHFIPREYISKYLAHDRKRTVLFAVLLGFVMSACSHGILAISMELYKKGASIASVISFLMASPWANLPVTIMLFAFFGWKGLLFVLSAIVIAIITGLIYQSLEAKGLIEKTKYKVAIRKGFSVWADIKKRWARYNWTGENVNKDFVGVLKGMWSVSKMVLWWIIIGTVFAALAGAYIPHDIFKQYLGPTILGLVITLIIATIIEVCSEGSAPLAFEIFKQTGAFGNAFVFLMAGVVTDVTEIGLIWSNIGKKAAIWLPIVAVPQVVLLAYFFNLLL